MSELLPKIDINVKLIWGEKDPWEPIQEARKWFSTYKCIRSLEIIPDAGHLSTIDSPEEFTAELSAFLAAQT